MKNRFEAEEKNVRKSCKRNRREKGKIGYKRKNWAWREKKNGDRGRKKVKAEREKYLR